MKRARFAALRTTAFRTAALSALFYALLTGAMVAIVFPLVSQQLQAQIRAGLQAESSALATLYSTHGAAALARVIRTRSSEVLPAGDNDADDPGRRYYALASPRGRILAGDLAHWPAQLRGRRWARLRIGHQAVRALVTELPDGERLLVGQSLRMSDSVGANAFLVIILGVALALAAGLAGGAAVGARVMHRIRAASTTAQRIQEGNLAARLPPGGPGEHDLLAGAFNTMLERIETAVLGLRDLAMRTAHEMRHPLARMDQALERAEQAADAGQAQAELERARGEIRELNRRIEALLRLARLESAHERREFFRRLDLAALVADLDALYARSAERAGHRLRVEAPQSVPYVGDRQLLAQAVANLLDNAVAYAAPGAEIVLALASDAHTATLAVRNAATAGGAPAPARGGRTVGAGLGLPIARAIAQLHYGRLEIDSTPAAFAARLILPLAPLAPGAEAPAEPRSSRAARRQTRAATP